MNGPGRAIHAAVWSMGGQFGPGGSIAVNSTTRPLPLRGPRGYDAAKGPERRWGADRTVFGLDSGVPRCPADAPRNAGNRRDGPMAQLAQRVSSTRPEGSPRRPRRGAPRADVRERLTLAAVLAWCSAIGVIDAFLVDGAVLIGLLITGPLLAALY